MFASFLACVELIAEATYVPPEAESWRPASCFLWVWTTVRRAAELHRHLSLIWKSNFPAKARVSVRRSTAKVKPYCSGSGRRRWKDASCRTNHSAASRSLQIVLKCTQTYYLKLLGPCKVLIVMHVGISSHLTLFVLLLVSVWVDFTQIHKQ